MHLSRHLSTTLLPRQFRTRLLACLLLLTLGLSPAVAAQAATDCELGGRVVDLSAEPIAEASVSVVGSDRTFESDGEGRFCLDELGAKGDSDLEIAEVQSDLEIVVYAEGFGLTALRVVAGKRAPIEVEMRPAFGEEMVITARQSRQRLADVPINLEVIERTKIRATVARTLADAVEWTSGVRVESNCQNCNTSQIRLLGLEGPYSQLLIDGQPTVSSLALVYGIEQLPARLIDSIEVVKGGGSALYGASAVAGVINLISHEPTHDHFELESRGVAMSGETGSSLGGTYDWYPGDGRQSLTMFGQRDFVAPVDVDGDGFTEVTRRELQSFGSRWQRQLFGDSARLRVEGSFTDEARRGGDQLHLPPQQTWITEQILSERRGLTASYLHSLSSRNDLRLAISHSDTLRNSYYGGGMDPFAYGDTENPLTIFDSQSNHYTQRGTWTWGLQASRDEIEDRQPGYGRVTSETYTSTGLFVQRDHEPFDQLTVLYGVRFDDHSAVGSRIVSPRLALMWSPRADLSVRTTLSRGFRPPVVFDEDLHITLAGSAEAQVLRNAQDLREETSTSGMISLEWRPTLGRRNSASLELNAFHTQIDDLFHSAEDDDPITQAIEFTRTNFGTATVEGAEINLGWRRGSNLQIDFGAGYQDAVFDRPEPDFGSLEFFRTPEHYGSASVLWSPGSYDVFAGVRHTGSMKAPHYAGFIAENRLETTEPFVTVDLSLTREIEVGSSVLAITIAAKNLTDAFQDDLDRGPLRDASYVYGPRFPRSISLGLRFTH